MTAPLPVADRAETLRTVRTLLRPRRRLAVSGFAVLTAATAVGLLTPPLLGHVVDLVAQRRPAEALTRPAVLLVAVALVQAAGTALGLGLVARLGETMLADLRERFLDRVLRLSLRRVEQAGAGDLTSRVGNDVTVIAEAVRSALPELARSLLAIVLTLVALAVLDWRFLLAALLAAPVQWHTARWYARRSSTLYSAHRTAVATQQQQLLETIGGAPTVRALRQSDAQVDRVVARSTAAVDLYLRAIRLLTRFYGRLNLAEFIALSAVLAGGYLLVGAGAVTIGGTAAAALYVHHLFGPMNSALRLVDDAQVAAASLARLAGVVQAEPPPAPHPAQPADGAVKAADLHFAYRPGHPVLAGVTIDLTDGETVAVVGASGAGKTTLAQLVAGVHRPGSGSVTIGGVDLADLTDADRRRTVALVTQEVHVFAGTLADDLRLARPDADDDALYAALADVEALDWALALPQGLQTVVGDGGHRLAVTEAQQLALARLILADPKVVILDEATADAGSAGARVLERAAARALRGRTALVVAHRLTQAAGADRIVVLDAGRVVETGTHDELRSRPDGRYATLWRAWSRSR
ncbi:ABC transporter ATP-binding protein [Jidongwangia harbinensis]|uniref:ABC transporter ATP-binding protein n=1 Tax=Jidongwangia harbinensis TaxID=2878561 RepID=UPI001CD9AB08|nr:ABC transporter ATP-binding protein [Jidongwangia harbinensis]MCA2215610.1 ABC transporter ATP-binding protein/permease [Jidongwangia harbinensis]